jgi:hypothetical protein
MIRSAAGADMGTTHAGAGARVVMSRGIYVGIIIITVTQPQSLAKFWFHAIRQA